MRLSNNQIFQNNIRGVLEGQQHVANAQQRVNTQQKYLSASESPSAINNAMLYSDKIQLNEQHSKNINLLKGRLELEESVLENINNTIVAAKSLTVQAGNGALNQQDKHAIASELKELQKTLHHLMNSQTEDGKYIFSGYQDANPAYTFNSTTGQYDYQGDQGEHQITIANGVKLRSSDNGFNVFESVAARLNVTSNTGVASGSITSGSVYIEKQAAFDLFHQQYYNGSPSAPANANTFNVVVSAGTPDQYEIRQNGVPLVPAVTGNVNADQQIEFAGMKINLQGAAPGQLDFTLDAPKKMNVLNTFENLIKGLEAGVTNNDDYQQILADGLTQLGNASEKTVFTQATLGGRMNSLERVLNSNSAQDIANKASKSDLVEIDMAQAISDLTKQETALKASQATFGRLANLSLFDYL